MPFFLFNILSTTKGQGGVFNPGKYKFAGSVKVQPNGDVNLRLNAKMVGAGPSLQPPSLKPPSLTPTQSTHGFTTGTPSGGTLSTGTGPTTGYTTPTEESERMAGIEERKQGSEKAERLNYLSICFLFFMWVIYLNATMESVYLSKMWSGFEF